MKTPSRSGELSETPFVDVLGYYCQSGQTAAVSITIPRASGGQATGAFFIEAGALVDARFDGREGSNAVRHALQVQLGRFQVEVGSRSSRRNVHETWTTLSASAPSIPPQDRPAPPTHFSADAGQRPTPPPAPLPRLTPQRPTPASASPPALPPTSGAYRAPPKASGPRPLTGEAVAAVASTGTAPPPPGIPFGAPATSGPRPLHTSGPSTSPFSGPHTPPPQGHPASAPFASVRREGRGSKLLRPAILLGLAVVVGGGLAAVVASLLNLSGQTEQPVAAAKASVAPATPPAASSVAGVSDSEVTLGIAAPLTGAAKELGRQMRVGLDVAFSRANASGGVGGRKVKLIALDDGYEPARTKEVMRELVEQKGVFSFVGNVGTPTAAVAVPYALERKMLFFGPFTGASLLRKEPPDRYVFNYRASYAEETAAIVRYLIEIRHIKPEQIAVFAQDDSYGDAGFQGVARVLRQLKKTQSAILKVTYTRNTSDVSDAVARVLDRKANVAAVVMVATYRPAARFIEKVREQRPNMVFTNVSFVGSQALAEELVQLGPQYAQGVIITQVVPLPTGQSTVGLRYREALARFAPEEKPDFISLEGYVTGNLLLEGLKLAGRNLTTDGLVDALESIHGLDLGLGVPLSFGLSEHQASHKVWGTVLDGAGSFQQLDLE
jgi:branched-chain amino acid transport system substrate-binding protein